MALLTGYRLMWMMVMFDLPVVQKRERHAATKFRNFLLDEGFRMCQYSVYMRMCAGKEKVAAISRRVGMAVPESGAVEIICFTDKQYESIVSFQGRTQHRRQNPHQYQLF